MITKQLKIKKLRREARTRSKLVGSAARPRFSVTVTGKHLIAQLVDDSAGKTLVYLSTAGKKNELSKNIESGHALGGAVAKAAAAKGITEVVFDRGSRRFHGRVKSIAEGARAAGLKF